MVPGRPAVRGRDVVDLLPHAGAARFVTRVVERRDESITCEARIPAASPYVKEGRCPTFVLIEAAAQAAAAFLASEPGAPPPSMGYLVRARDMTLACGEIAIDRGFEAVAERTGAAEPLHMFHIVVRDESQTLLRGSIGIYVERGSTTGG